MNCRFLALSFLCLIAILPCRMAQAATITHDTAEHFLSGISDGLAVVALDQNLPETGSKNAGVALVPQPGTPVISDDFNYASQAAAETAGWSFFMGDPPGPTPPSSFSFTATPGSLRMSVGRTQDFHNPGLDSQNDPMIAYRSTPVTGDFVIEAKMTFAEARQNERSQGVFIGSASEFEPYLAVDNNLRYVAFGTEHWDRLLAAGRFHPDKYPVVATNQWHTAPSYIIRVVKRGQYYYGFHRTSESDPWIFHHWFRAPQELDGSTAHPVVVGLYGKSWNPNHPDKIQNIDFDYFRVSRINPDLTGEFTNVMDAGMPASWSALSIFTHAMQGLKIQMRTGNTLANGTLTDAGPFVGPDGTASTFFEDDVAMKVPSPVNKRYLEYKVFLDQAAENIPASLLALYGDFQPAVLGTSLLSSEADFGPGGSGVSVQTGGGDLSLTRTQVVLENFDSITLGPEWTFRAGNPGAVPPGEYTLTERPGYLRLKVGWEQDMYSGGTELGGVGAIRTLPDGLGDFEVETEVNTEIQQNRGSGIVLWQDKDNYAGVILSRRNYFEYLMGPMGETVLSDASGPSPGTFYGTNSVQFRIAKVGQILTVSFRDVSGPSTSWRTLYTWNTARGASGATDFAPIHVMLLGKSWNDTEAVRGNVDADFNYLKISSLALNGTKDVQAPLPAANKPDVIVTYGESLSPETAKFQMQTAGGAWVGPDGTAGSFFTANEPKIPAALANQATANIRMSLNAQQAAGVPYIHALGVQYAVPGTRLERDTNSTDFSGTKSGIGSSVPGLLTGMLELGTPVAEEFSATPSGWLMSDVNPGGPTPTLTFTGTAARLFVPRSVDTWGGGGVEDKPRAFAYRDQILSGDYEIEGKINILEPRQTNRHAGIAFVAARPEGTTKDNKIDMTNILMFGPYQDTQMKFLRAVNNDYGDLGPAGWSGQTFYLRVRKIGNTFTAFAKVNEADPWVQVEQFTHPNLNNAYVGFLAKSWPQGGETAPQTYDFDYLRVTPIVATSGTYESRVFDLGATGLFPMVGTQGGNSGDVRIQWRSADTTAALAAAPWVGPDGTGATTYAATYQGYLPASTFGKRYFQYRATLPVGATLNDMALFGLTTGPASPLANAITALRIAGGLDAATPAQATSLDLVKGDSAGKIEIVDAVAVARTALGL